MAVQQLRPRVFVLATVVAFVWPAVPRDAFGWAGREHRALGAESYIAACNRLAPLKGRDAQTAFRFEIACGHLDVQSLLYGQGTAVGGDFLGDADEFMTALGASLVTQRANYYLLALRNSTHFQPLATREWRTLHKQATAGALAASRKQGVAQIEAFEQTFYDSAFGDHFLQDSFAAGHMGFNRPGSSAGASLVFHNEWNRRGRLVSNRRGAVWKTYGDGRLDNKENEDARKHVIAACTESVYGVLAAFVLGTYDPAPDIAVWNEVAFTVEAPELIPDIERLFGGSQTLSRPDFLPLLAVKRAAVKDGIVGVWSTFSFPFDDFGHPSGVFVAGGDLIIPWFGTRVEAGAGIGFQGSLREPRFAIDAGLVKPLGLSVDGLLSHELDLGSVFLIGEGLDVTLRLSLRTNIEAGDMMLRLDIGPSFNINDAELGLYAGLGFAKVLHAAGGGGLF